MGLGGTLKIIKSQPSPAMDRDTFTRIVESARITERLGLEGTLTII